MDRQLSKSDYKIWFDSISMEFPGVLALDNVTLGVLPGTIHVMMGENGAGKSTLMKVLNGINIPTRGRFYIDGEEKRFSSALDAKHSGVAMIYQELNYIPDMTVERYLMLGNEQRRGCFIDWKAVSREARRMLDEENLDYNPKEILRNLSVSDIQLLEITKNIRSEKMDILIMDEPTSALSTEEVDRLFEKIKMLKQRGVTILYISHKMDEIFRIADTITVMRDGHHIKTAPVNEFTEQSLVRMMVDREISDVYPKKDCPVGDVVLEVEHLSCAATGVKDVSFNVRAGEIVGLGGLMGAGRSEAARALYGIDRADTGTVKVGGKPARIRSTRDAIASGIAMATEDRRRTGLVLCRNLKENISLSSLGAVSRLSFLKVREEGEVTKRYYDQMGVRATGLQAIASTLSGGNQQKVVLAKCLMTEARVLILDEPTRGIDVGAKQEIYQMMVQLASQGIAIIMISSELPEFVSMCDRAYVMYRGGIVKELDKQNLTQEQVVFYATGGGER